MVPPSDMISLRITLRHRDLDEFANRYAENISAAGIFVRTKSPKAPGTKLRFDIVLADGTRALRGEGVVVTVRGDGKPGMAIRFNILDADSRALIDRIVFAHGNGALAPTPLSTSRLRTLGTSEGKGRAPSTGRRFGTGRTDSGSSALPQHARAHIEASEPENERAPSLLPRQRISRPWARSDAIAIDPSNPNLLSSGASAIDSVPEVDVPSQQETLGSEFGPAENRTGPKERFEFAARSLTEETPRNALAGSLTHDLELEAAPSVSLEHGDEFKASGEFAQSEAPESSFEAKEAHEFPAGIVFGPALETPALPSQEDAVIAPPDAGQTTSEAGLSNASLTPNARLADLAPSLVGEAMVGTDEFEVALFGSDASLGYLAPAPLADVVRREDNAEQADWIDSLATVRIRIPKAETLEAARPSSTPEEAQATFFRDPADEQAPGAEDFGAALDAEASAGPNARRIADFEPSAVPAPHALAPEAEQPSARDSGSFVEARLGDTEVDGALRAELRAGFLRNLASREDDKPDEVPSDSSRAAMPESLALEPRAIAQTTVPTRVGLAELFSEAAATSPGLELPSDARPFSLEPRPISESLSGLPSPAEAREDVDSPHLEPAAPSASTLTLYLQTPTSDAELEAQLASASLPKRDDAKSSTPGLDEDPEELRARETADLRAATVDEAPALLREGAAPGWGTAPASVAWADALWVSWHPPEAAVAQEPSKFGSGDAVDLVANSAPDRKTTHALSAEPLPAPTRVHDEPEVPALAAAEETPFEALFGLSYSLHEPSRGLAMDGSLEAESSEASAAWNVALMMDGPRAPTDEATEEAQEALAAQSIADPFFDARVEAVLKEVDRLTGELENAVLPRDSSSTGLFYERSEHAQPLDRSGWPSELERSLGLHRPESSSLSRARDPIAPEGAGPETGLIATQIIERPAALEREAPRIERAPPRTAELFGEERTEISTLRRGGPLASLATAQSRTPLGGEPGTRILGVDLGGNAVRVGWLERGELESLNLGAGPLPAVVAARQDGALMTGASARAIALDEPARTSSPRSLLWALGHPSLAASLGLTSHDGEWQLRLGERSYSLREVLTYFFGELQSAIAQKLSTKQFRVAISVPVNLDPQAYELMLAACSDARLSVARLIPEPEAMLRAHNLEEHSIETALVLDVGATHAGLTVARRGADGFSVVASAWEPSLSAGALDAVIADLALDELLEQTGQDHRGDPKVKARLMAAAEAARVDLKRSSSLELKVALSAPGGASGVVLEHVVRLPLARVHQHTERVILSLCARARELFHKADINPRLVGAVVVAGSGGQYPPLLQALQELTRRDPLLANSPVNVALLGLARAAAALERLELIQRPDALAASIGIELGGGRFHALLPAGTPLPAKLERTYPTTRADQTELELRFFQGDAEFVRSCTALGALALRGLPRGDKGQIKLTLSLEVATDGVLTMRLLEPRSLLETQRQVATQQTSEERRHALATSATYTSNPPGAPKTGLLNRLFKRK